MGKNKKIDNCIQVLTDHLSVAEISYEDAVNLCMCLYAEGFPGELKSLSLTMLELGDLFSRLASNGFVVKFDSSVAVRLGANYHDFRTSGHWVEVMASIFKLGTSYERDRVISLFKYN